MHYKLLIKGLKQIVQITDKPDVEFLKGDQMKDIKVLNSVNESLCVLTAHTGHIAYVGEENGLDKLGKDLHVDQIIHSKGGDRVHEFAMKLAGATYMEVQAAGGGIIFTTSHTKAASEEELLDDFLEISRQMLKCGTTTLEAKSGYGLETDTELKMLHVLDKAAENTPLEISATFCGAHAIPKGANEDDQTKKICEEMIPKIKEEKTINGRLKNLENIDVFCEKGVFGVDSARQILKSGQGIGLYPNFHAEELNYIGGVEMGAELRARAMSHLEEISEEGIQSMAKSESVAVLLPSTAFILRLKPPPARRMIEQGVIVALGSDFNPNAFCLAMPMIMHFACVTMHLSMQEALVAATLNSAHSLGRGRTHGAIATSRQADFVLLNANSWEHIIYRIAGHDSIISMVVKKGEVVYNK